MNARYDMALLAAGFLVGTTLHSAVVAATDTTGPNDLRHFEPKSATWAALFVDPQIASVARFTGAAVEDRIVLDGPDLGPEDTLWSFNVIRTETFVLRDQASNDGGETRRLQSDYHMKRRDPGPGEQ